MWACQATDKVSQIVDKGKEAYDRARSNVSNINTGTPATGTTGSTGFSSQNQTNRTT